MSTENFSVETKVNEVECHTWADFMKFIDEKHRRSRGMLFRGQRESGWPIESTLLRAAKKQLRYEKSEWSEEEIERFAATWSLNDGGMVMQSYVSHLSRRNPTTLTDEQVWMTGRHQGLLTPFIDWTKSPYVAAFFGAVEVVENQFQNSGRYFAIYIVSEWLFPFKLAKRSADNGQLNRYALKVDAAHYGNERAIAQNAVGTYTYPQTDLETFVHETNAIADRDKSSFSRILIPHSQAEDALSHLHLMNINYTTLFPDAFGMAKQGNLNFYMNVEGMGNWHKPPGFDTLIPEEGEEHI